MLPNLADSTMFGFGANSFKCQEDNWTCSLFWGIPLESNCSSVVDSHISCELKLVSSRLDLRFCCILFLLDHSSQVFPCFLGIYTSAELAWWNQWLSPSKCRCSVLWGILPASLWQLGPWGFLASFLMQIFSEAVHCWRPNQSECATLRESRYQWGA